MQIVGQNEEGAYTSGSTTTLIVEQSVEGLHTSDVTRKQIFRIVRKVNTPVMLPENRF